MVARARLVFAGVLRKGLSLLSLSLLLFGLTLPAAALSRADVPVDRALVRFSAPEMGGDAYPQFIFARELAFEARLAAFKDPLFEPGKVPFRPHHVQEALERHIAETLLSSLAINPVPTDAEVSEQRDLAQKIEEQAVGGAARLQEAARAEGLDELEVKRIFRTRARAALYLHQMVAPMLTPTELTLRRIHQEVKNPYQNASFESIAPALRNWWIGLRLQEAASSYYQNARARLKLVFL